jgi:hypothetical protein
MVNPTSNNRVVAPTTTTYPIYSEKSEKANAEIYDKQSFEKKVVNTYIDCCLFYIKDRYDRMAGYQENPSLLEKGIFYANEHFLAMQAVLPILCEKATAAKNEYTALLGQLMQENVHKETKTASQLALEKYTKLNIQYTKLQRLYNHLYQEGCYFHGYQNPEYFDFIKSDIRLTGFEIHKFQIKKGFQPAEIVDAFNNGLTFTDCLITIASAARYNTLRKLWGDEKFNIVFSFDSKTAIRYDADFTRLPLSIFSKIYKEKHGQKSIAGRRNVTHGHLYWIQNSSLYNSKHYNGMDQGINLICLNEKPKKQLFTGFGLPPEGMNEQQINEILLQSFNAAPIGLKILPEKYHHRLRMDEARAQQFNKPLDKKEYQETGGGKFICYSEEFNRERILQVAHTPIEKVRALVDSWL